MFPTVPVPRNGIKELWKEDALLLAADVKDGRAVMDAVERLGTIPSLPQLKSMFRSLKAEQTTQAVCVVCDGTSWVYQDENNLRSGVVKCKSCS
jgi:ribosomal protein L10